MAEKVATLGKHGAPARQDGAGKHAAEAAGHPVARVAAIVVSICLGVLVVAYLVGVAVFARMVFVLGTSVNGEDVSLRATSEVAAAHSGRADSYVLAVTGQGLDFKVPATNIGLSIDGEAYVAAAQAQLNPWMWPLLATQSRDLEVATSSTFDEAKLDRLVDSAVEAVNLDATPPVDAEVTLDAETGTYVVSGGVAGTELDAAAVADVVAQALHDLEPTLAIGDTELVQPAVPADDEALVAEAAALNRFVGATQTLTVAGSEVHVVDGNQIAQWLSVADDKTVTVNADAVTAWARGELSERLDSVGATRTYTRADGKAVEVSGGTYGWSIDGATLASQIVANIQEGTAATLEVPMLQTAAAWNPGAADWGARYIDIDLSEQYVRFYDDAGNLAWESSCVSGDMSHADRATPTGTYSITGSMATGDVELRGKIDPATGQPEYISHVTYWMPFVDNAVALHDASWRSSFGGSIYQTNGSHGCVNLPTDAAARLYGMVHVGDVVVCHW